MPDKELSLKLNDDDVKRKLNEDIQLAERLEEALKRAANAMSSTGQGTPGQPGSAATASPGRAASGISSTASAAASPPPNSAAMSAAASMPSGAPMAAGGYGGPGMAFAGSGRGGSATPGGMPYGMPGMMSGPMTGIGGGPSFSGAGFSVLGAGVGTGVQGASDLLNWMTNRARSGGFDAMGLAGSMGRGAGTLIGGIAGSFGGPFGTMAGMAIGGGVVESATRLMAAPLQNRLDAVSAISVLQSDTNRVGMVGGVGNAWRSALRVGQIVDEANAGLAWNSPLRQPEGGGAAAANVFTALNESLLSGGIDPFTRSGSRVYGMPSSQLESDRAAIASGRGGTGARALAGRDLLASLGYGRERAGETYFRRLTTLYHNNLDEGYRTVGDIFANLPETGGNTADILLRYGASKTNVYLRLGNDDLKSPLETAQLAETSGRIRGDQRLQGLGALQVRGSGTAQARALAGELVDISTLPGGKDSMAFAQAKNAYASAYTLAGQQSDIVNFGIPGVRIEGRMQRAQMMPYSPSRMFELSGQQVQLNMGQIGVLKSRIETMRTAGTLSEEAELQMTSQIEGLRNQNASNFAMMSEGRENLIPGLVAGHRRTVGATDSLQLAAMSYNRGGVPFRNAGAINGQQLAMQNAYSDMIGLGEGDIFPRSRSQAMNNMGMGGGAASAAAQQETNALLRQILDALHQRGGGGGYGGPIQGQRNSGPIGQAFGNLESRNIGQGNNSISRGGYD